MAFGENQPRPEVAFETLIMVGGCAYPCGAVFDIPGVSDIAMGLPLVASNHGLPSMGSLALGLGAPNRGCFKKWPPVKVEV
jgi:hypothetical protein